MNGRDNTFMDLALKEAAKAMDRGEIPVGAIIVDKSGEVIAKAFNNTETMKCQTGHAEILAIQEAARKVNNWRLEGCTMYVTLEPCIMCFGLIALSRMESLVYGLKSPLFGCDIDNKDTFPLYKKHLNVKALESLESSKLLRTFFERRRS